MKGGNINSSNFKADSWFKIYENNFVSTTATSITISGLKGDTDKEYMLEARIVNGYNGAATFGVRPNNDTGTNYGYQFLKGVNATVSAVRGTATNLVLCASDTLGTLSFGNMVLFAKSGYVRTSICQYPYEIALTSVGGTYIWGESWNNTSDEITSLVVQTASTGGIGSGSYITLWAKRFHG